MKHLLTFLLVCAFFATANAQSTCCFYADEIIERQVTTQSTLKANYCYVVNVFDASGRIVESFQITRSEPLFLGRAQILECN